MIKQFLQYLAYPFSRLKSFVVVLLIGSFTLGPPLLYSLIKPGDDLGKVGFTSWLEIWAIAGFALFIFFLWRFVRNHHRKKKVKRQYTRAEDKENYGGGYGR